MAESPSQAPRSVNTLSYNHPLYLGALDTPQAVQVGMQLTGMKNHALWSCAMKLWLLVKNKQGFIDGTVK
ncbi:hypothetical protein P3L10_033941 [Capsicum annuum]